MQETQSFRVLFTQNPAPGTKLMSKQRNCTASFVARDEKLLEVLTKIGSLCDNRAPIVSTYLQQRALEKRPVSLFRQTLTGLPRRRNVSDWNSNSPHKATFSSSLGTGVVGVISSSSSSSSSSCRESASSSRTFHWAFVPNPFDFRGLSSTKASIGFVFRGACPGLQSGAEAGSIWG